MRSTERRTREALVGRRFRPTILTIARTLGAKARQRTLRWAWPLALAVALLASCSGGNETEPTATAGVSRSPSPELATPSPTSPSGYGHPPGTSTGNLTLDDLVATILSPAEEIEPRLVATPTACILEPKGTGELPKCPEGAPEGTIIDVFRATDCDAAEPESVLRALASMAAQPRSLFAVYKSQTEAGSWVPAGDFTILVVLESDSRAPGAGIQFRVAGSGIVGIKFGCGKLARDLVREIPRSDFLVAPK